MPSAAVQEVRGLKANVLRFLLQLKGHEMATSREHLRSLALKYAANHCFDAEMTDEYLHEVEVEAVVRKIDLNETSDKPKRALRTVADTVGKRKVRARKAAQLHCAPAEELPDTRRPDLMDGLRDLTPEKRITLVAPLYKQAKSQSEKDEIIAVSGLTEHKAGLVVAARDPLSDLLDRFDGLVKDLTGNYQWSIWHVIGIGGFAVAAYRYFYPDTPAAEESKPQLADGGKEPAELPQADEVVAQAEPSLQERKSA